MNVRVIGLAVATVLSAAGCGPNLTATPTSPTTNPTGPSTLSSLLQPRIDGLWGGPVTLTGIAGGTGAARTAGALECTGRDFIAVLGETNDHTLSLTRDRTDPTALTARLSSAGTGLSCNYTGRIGADNTISLVASQCSFQTLNFLCHPDEFTPPLPRQLTLVGSTITATANGPVNVTEIVNGTAAHTFNIEGDGGNIGALVANHTFPSFTRR